MGIGGFLGKALARVYPNTLLELVRRAGLNPSSRVLDVGCGGAGLLRSLADLGVTDVLGIDPFVDADIVYANGATIRRQQLDQVTGKWDIIMFNHSLEHMPGQVQVMRTAAELLAPAGTCLVRIPTVSSLAWQTYHQHWVQIDAPRHLYLHSRRSIAILAGKAGLEVSLIVDDSTAFQFWGSEQVKRNIATYEESSLLRQNGTSTFSRKALRYYERRAARLNADGIGDQAAFFLRRIDQYA
jgi:SAM-dependent methyltransferase